MRVRVLVIVMVLMLVGCGGGDDDGGGGGGADAGDPGGGDGDAGPGGVFDEPAEGQFDAFERRYASHDPSTGVTGSFLDGRPVSHELLLEEGECRMWVHHVGDCGEECVHDGMGGICGPDGTCQPFPTLLSAGDLEVSAPGGTVTLVDSEYGYSPTNFIDGDLAAPGQAVTLTAPGGADVDAFELEARGVLPIALGELEDAGGGEANALVLVDGDDVVVTWEPAGAGDRVRLDLMTDNTGHGLPVLEWIECDSADDGSITLPQAMIEALPDKVYSDVCAGTDCPLSELSRYTEDRKSMGDRDVALRVGSQQLFVLVVQ